jgi:hypothetical protein
MQVQKDLNEVEIIYESWARTVSIVGCSNWMWQTSAQCGCELQTDDRGAAEIGSRASRKMGQDSGSGNGQVQRTEETARSEGGRDSQSSNVDEGRYVPECEDFARAVPSLATALRELR